MQRWLIAFYKGGEYKLPCEADEWAQGKDERKQDKEEDANGENTSVKTGTRELQRREEQLRRKNSKKKEGAKQGQK